MASIVFIGDSITDCGRTKAPDAEFGQGYAAQCIAQLRAQVPGLPAYNRGIGGHCIGGVHGRWQRDCLDLKPRVVSLLIGINDVDFSYRRPDHVFDEALLIAQLDEMFAALGQAGAQLILLEPFGFEGPLYHDEFFPRLQWLRGQSRPWPGIMAGYTGSWP